MPRRKTEEMKMEHCECLEKKLNDATINEDITATQRQDLLSNLKKKEEQLALRYHELHDTVLSLTACESRLKSQEQTLRQTTADLEEVRAQYSQSEKQNNILKEELKKLKNDAGNLSEERERWRQMANKLKKENQLMTEREARKDEILQSYRIRQERNESEISHLRQLYERMHQELTQLQVLDDVVEDNGPAFTKPTSYSSQVYRQLPPHPNNSNTLAEMSSTDARLIQQPTSNSLLVKMSSSPDLSVDEQSSRPLQIIPIQRQASKDQATSHQQFQLATSRSITEKCNRILSDMDS